MAARAQPERAGVDIGPCVTIESAVERLACYDELAESALRGRDGADAAQATRDVSPAQPDRSPPAASVSFDEITSDVVGLREIQPGRLEITLANGQVWRQTHSDRYRLRVGHQVRLYRASPQAQYVRLTAPAIRGFVQVERVR